MTLEGKPPEGAESTQIEGAKATQVEEPTLTDTPEFRKELDRALGKGLESTNRQLSLQKATADAAKAEAAKYKADREAFEASMRDTQSQLDDLVKKQFADDPEARQAYIDRRAIADDRRNLATEKAEAASKLLEAEKLAYEVVMNRKIDVMVKETGISREDLIECQSEAEVGERALRYQVEQKPPQVEVKETPTFDSGASSGAGGKTYTVKQIQEMDFKKFEETFGDKSLMELQQAGRIKE